jgi:hypothetical protein
MTFSQKQEDLQLTVDALEEALADLTEDLNRLRNTNRILRAVNSGLRSKLEIAHKNDEEFVSACQEDVESEWDLRDIPFIKSVSYIDFDEFAKAIDPESDATGYVEERSDYPQAFREHWGIT